MARPDSHKELVHAIIDSELDSLKIIKRATDLAPTLAQRLVTVARRIVKLRAAGTIDAKTAKRLYLEAYISLTLVGVAEVGQDVLDHAEPTTARIVKAAKALGADVVKVDAIRKADKMTRAMERAGAQTDGVLGNGSQA